MQMHASAVHYILWQGCLSVCLSQFRAVSNWLNIIVKYFTTTGSLMGRPRILGRVVFLNLWQMGSHKES